MQFLSFIGVAGLAFAAGVILAPKVRADLATDVASLKSYVDAEIAKLKAALPTATPPKPPGA